MLPAGRRLGPYEVLSLLGAGGMGEVYRALDPRLGREVALKVIRGPRGEDDDRLRRFELEARATASLNHPNILTVHDVGRAEGATFIVSELLEGETLRSVLTRRWPPVRQSLSLAMQAAQGLAAAHQKGIVHRDFKPENLFLTSDGRVKILDFGLAKLTGGLAGDSGEVSGEASTSPGVLMGTVAYMSPEQAEERAVDGRSDIFSLGVVLYELLARRHPFRRDTVAGTLTAILHETPPGLASLDPTIPPAVDGIVRRCLEKDRKERFQSAHDLALALESALALPPGAASHQDQEPRSPYPGLSSFTERDAAAFFGREAEVAALWQRLRSRTLLAVIGSSGAGKSSLVRAGVVASRPAGWEALVCTPGAAPFRALGRALAPELASDPDALRQLVSFEETDVAVDLVGRWRRAHTETLLVVDQFEELFTLNPSETQARFATLLGRLASELGVHVLLALRDDFLVRCSEHEALLPIFESLTPLAGLTRDALRRALVEPAAELGWSFEDESLVEEMILAIEGSRGALPLLAFAIARLWERRDSERKLLTRKAYQEIGGVAGALAQHAEATLDRIGPERQHIVREIFRNLVTAQGTRALADRAELLSLFGRGEDAELVLRELIGSRLLTSYELEGAEGPGGHQRVELVHESLLRSWPRLVRWQAQDEEGAVLRDQLKQAARLWQVKGRTADLLWSGTAYREYALWRERYGGALTTVEDEFGRAMRDRAQRRKRLLRGAATAAFLAVAAIAVAVGISRQQVAKARDRAEAEALRAEAGKLLALARTEVDRYPTAALAYVRKSLELADTPEARRFVVDILWRGPVARILPVDRIARGLDARDNPAWIGPVLSPDGNWMVVWNRSTRRILLFSRDGAEPRSLPPLSDTDAISAAFSPASDLLIVGGSGHSLRFYSLADLREVRRVELGGVHTFGWMPGQALLTFTQMSAGDPRRLIRRWVSPAAAPKVVGTIDMDDIGDHDIDPSGRWLVYGRGRQVLLRSLDPSRVSRDRLIGTHQDDVLQVTFSPTLGRVASTDRSGEIRIWSWAESTKTPLHVLQGPKSLDYLFAIDAQGSRLARAVPPVAIDVWDLRDPPQAEPLVLRRPESSHFILGGFDPSGQWLVSNNAYTIAFWPLSGPWKRVLPGYISSTWSLSFAGKGQWLISCGYDEPARLWPLRSTDGAARALLPLLPCWGAATHPVGSEVLVGTPKGGAMLYPLAEGSPRALETGWEGVVGTYAVAFDRSGQRAAACPRSGMGGIKDPRYRVLRVWELASGRARSYSLAHLTGASWDGFNQIRFARDGSLFVGGDGGVRRLVLPADPEGAVTAEAVHVAGRAHFALSDDGRLLLVCSSPKPGAGVFEDLRLFDLQARTSRPITTHGRRLFDVAFGPSARVIVTGDVDGVVRAGPVTGEEPHLLLGHSTWVLTVAVSPDNRWIASVSEDAFHLWPMPDVTKPPLHTLPYAELMAKLGALTNLRVVSDSSTSTGWQLDVGPFPGWRDVPTW